MKNAKQDECHFIHLSKTKSHMYTCMCMYMYILFNNNDYTCD